MFKVGKNTLLQQVALTDFKDAVDNLTLHNPDVEHFVDGNVLFKTLPHRTSIKEISESTKVVINRSLQPEELKAFDHKELFTNVTDKIIAFEERMLLPEALQKISLIQEKLGKTFYGALLIAENKSIKLNPLHPLVAMSLINPNDLSQEYWKLMIFTYADRKRMDIHYKSDAADKAIIAKNISSQINSYVSRAEYGSKVVKVEAANNRQVTVTTKSRKHPEEDPNFELLVVAHQLLTDGIVAPLYGTSLLKMTSDKTTGINVTPMLSANIKQDTSYGNGTQYDSNGNTESPVITYNSVCTGSQNNRTLEGLRTLTHSNTLSPYNRNTLMSGALVYADECNLRSLEMYRIAGMIERKALDVPNNENTTETETETPNQ